MRTRKTSLSLLLATCALIAAACGGKSGGGSTPTPAPSGTVSPCARPPAAADRDRFVVVAHPYDASANASNAWEVLSLSSAGTLAKTGTIFQMGRATYGRVAFTPDGEIGLVAQEDGTVGVFRVGAAGAVSVIETGFAGTFYANSVAVSPDGSHAIVVDGDTPENGGGFYGLDIGCDGRVATNGLFVGARTPSNMEFLGDGRAVAASEDYPSAPAGSDAVLLEWDGAAAPTLDGGADVFGDDTAIVSDMTVTSAARYALVLDDNQFSGTGDRVGIASIAGSSIAAAQVLAPTAGTFSDPASIVASPFDQTALVALAQGNAIRKLSLGSAGTWSVSTIAYTGGTPQLPEVLVEVGRGALAGRVMSAENLGIRSLELSPGHGVTDLGVMTLGTGLDAITGALGVQP